jgi:hypothetical protein
VVNDSAGAALITSNSEPTAAAAVALLITEAVYLAKAFSNDIGARGEGRSKWEGSLMAESLIAEAELVFGGCGGGGGRGGEDGGGGWIALTLAKLTPTFETGARLITIVSKWAAAQ